jgi:hypothetical protein
MTIETVTHISDLNQSYPASGDDPSEGDDHIRNIKKALATDFANINAAVTATPTQLNNIGLVLISTATASSVATVDFTSGITSAYDEYELHIVNAIPATTGVGARLLTTLDGSNWDVTNYSSSFFDSTANSTSTANIMLSDATAVSNTTNSPGLCCVVKVFAPSGTTANKAFTVQSVYGTGTGGMQTGFGGAIRATTSAVTGLRFLFSSGNITSGLFKMYGVKK